jgi:hypothetical protein
MGETSDHVGITLIQLAPGRTSNVRPLNFKFYCETILCLGSVEWSRLVTGTLQYIHEEKIYNNKISHSGEQQANATTMSRF